MHAISRLGVFGICELVVQCAAMVGEKVWYCQLFEAHRACSMFKQEELW